MNIIVDLFEMGIKIGSVLLILPKLQLQVEHFGKMAATSGCIKVVEKCIE